MKVKVISGKFDFTLYHYSPCNTFAVNTVTFVKLFTLFCYGKSNQNLHCNNLHHLSIYDMKKHSSQVLLVFPDCAPRREMYTFLRRPSCIARLPRSIVEGGPPTGSEALCGE